jgi:hypothetical protein
MLPPSGLQRARSLGVEVARELIVLIAGEPAEPAEIAQNAAVEDGGDRDEILVGGRRSFLEDR